MLSHVAIRHFQSLHDVALELKPFTVIVGPSSSGKSAFTRALKCLTSNARGDSFITHGENQTVIKARTDRGTVALLRGKKNEYVLIPEGDEQQQKVFTKLAGGVPEEVSEFIGIPAKDPLNYSNQFDMPYLLTSSAAEVARTLGELTNVSVIFEASREANKRRLAASSTLKTRAGDYADLTQNLDKFRSLKDDMAVLEQAEQQFARVQTLQTRIARLEAILSSITAIPEVPAAKSYPDLTAVEAKQQRITRLETLLFAVHNWSSHEQIHTDLSHTAQEAAVDAEAEYTEALKAMGTCPTCGQDTEHIHATALTR